MALLRQWQAYDFCWVDARTVSGAFTAMQTHPACLLVGAAAPANLSTQSMQALVLPVTPD